MHEKNENTALLHKKLNNYGEKKGRQSFNKRNQSRNYKFSNTSYNFHLWSILQKRQHYFK